MGKNCKFGEALEENIRDQIIFGLKNDVIRQRLLSEKALNYAKAVEIS